MTLFLLFLPATAHAACTSPAGVAGEFRFSNDRAALQYCDGDNWVMAGLGSYLPVPVSFDGTNDYLSEAGGISVSNTKQVTGSLWLRNSQATGTSSFIFQFLGTGFRLGLDGTTRGFEVQAENAASTTILNHISTDPLNDGRWHHVLFSYDLSDSNKAHMIIDGVADAAVPATYIDDTMDIAGYTTTVGSDFDGTKKFQGDLADVWINFGTYVDLSNANNRRRFISDNGMPMYAGDDGSLLTGSKPDVFLSGDVDTWHTNIGSAGGFTENGALTLADNPIPLPAAPNSTVGLVGHWKLDETSGTTATDSAGTNDGTLTNFPASPWTEGWYNGGLEFDGANDYIDIAGPVPPDGASAITISVWVNADSTGVDNSILGTLLGSNQDDSSGLRYDAAGFLGGGTNLIKFAVKNKSGSSSVGESASNVQTTGWQHIVLRWSSGSAPDLFIDGSETAYTSAPASLSGTADFPNFYIGAGLRDGPGEWDGVIDDVRLYNRVLADWEIAALYSGTCSSPSGTGGTMLYNTDYKVMQYCNGAEWVAMSKIGGTGGTGCASPAGNTGEIRYDSANNVMQYCNTEDWVNIGKVTPPSDGLVAHWRLDETSGSTIADDTGTHNGTWSDGVDNDVTGETVTGKSGNALHLDGTDDLISVPDNAALDITGPITLAAWVNFDSLSVGNDENRLFYKGSGNYGNNLYTLDVKDGLFNMTFGTDPNTLCNASNEYCVDSATTVSTGTWYHVVATYDGSIGRMYINGALDNSNVFTHTATANSDTLVIGGRSGSIDMLDGIIDDVRIYNRALTATEVTSLYNATR